MQEDLLESEQFRQEEWHGEQLLVVEFMKNPAPQLKEQIDVLLAAAWRKAPPEQTVQFVAVVMHAAQF